MTSESSDPKVNPPADSTAVKSTPANHTPAGQPGSGQKDAHLRSKRLWSTSELMGSETEILIEHNGSIYRLRRTRQGKLILSK